MIPENPKTLKAETLANTESKSPEVKENTGAQTRHTPTTCTLWGRPIRQCEPSAVFLTKGLNMVWQSWHSAGSAILAL